MARTPGAGAAHERSLRLFLRGGGGWGVEYLATENGAGHLGYSDMGFCRLSTRFILFSFFAGRSVRLILHANAVSSGNHPNGPSVG